ncbi:hypothetical protein [Zunongwangia sp. H14]|uniref:hypothetical protein n=1 Tax=Zunongwangia sp. H14 TaxID=3240792 RepID=UPI00356B3F63
MIISNNHLKENIRNIEIKILLFLKKYGLILGGIVMIIVSLIGVRNGFIEQKITEENRIVNVRVLELSKSRSNYYLKLQHDEKSFVERIDATNFRKVKGKEEIQMLTNEEHSKFIFPDSFKKNIAFS